MKIPILHKLDFRSVVASLPVIFILMGFSAGSLFSGNDLQSDKYGKTSHEFARNDKEVDADSHNSQAEGGMAGESQPATIPDTRWTGSTFYFGNDQSRKSQFSKGPSHSPAGEERNSILSQTNQTSLASVSSKLGRRYTLIGHKPSGTS